MKEERFFYTPSLKEHKDKDIIGFCDELPQEEAVHAVRVLRLAEGDEINLMDGAGTFYRARVTMVTGKRCAYEILSAEPQQRPWPQHLHIAMAPTKMMDRVEWMVEKATEIGVDEFSFLNCKFSERRQMRSDRVEKIVVSAMKQSRKAWAPKVNELTDFKAFIDSHSSEGGYICHCYDEIKREDLFSMLKKEVSPTLVLIGPEGDFSIDEVRYALDHGFKSVSLGNSRLRTETAALFAVAQMHLV